MPTSSSRLRSSMFNDESDSLPVLIDKLPFIFQKVSLYRKLLCCKGQDAQDLLDLFQSVLIIQSSIAYSKFTAAAQILDRPNLNYDLRRNLIVVIQRLSVKAGLYPKCYELKDQIQTGDEPVAAGGFADIYKGTFKGETVCIKVMRVYESSDKEHIMKQFSREVLLWGQLLHPNVLPVYGLYRLRGRPCLVMPWMEHGDVNKYLKERPSVSRLSLVVDVAYGLEYLHKNGIIHGDLKGANILIGDNGRAYVADFGISSVSDPKILAWTSHSSVASKGGSVRWQAPELFDMENDELMRNTESSDVYAWACVCYEIFTGRIPLDHISRDPAVIYHVKSGARPTKPKADTPSWSLWGLNEHIWSIMSTCWLENPARRPKISHILQGLSVDQPDATSTIMFLPTRFRMEVERKDTFSELSSIQMLSQLVSKMEEQPDSTMLSELDISDYPPSPPRVAEMAGVSDVSRTPPNFTFVPQIPIIPSHMVLDNVDSQPFATPPIPQDSLNAAGVLKEEKPWRRRACRRCRMLKVKCEFGSETDPCKRCLNGGHECLDDRRRKQVGVRTRPVLKMEME
ncbi:hypothetical protein H0H93_005214 [Arthromyces matolae]|nr:hypothetical protein H0H93_005214 [Arthromyces matolae]